MVQYNYKENRQFLAGQNVDHSILPSELAHPTAEHYQVLADRFIIFFLVVVCEAFAANIDSSHQQLQPDFLSDATKLSQWLEEMTNRPVSMEVSGKTVTQRLKNVEGLSASDIKFMLSCGLFYILSVRISEIENGIKTNNVEMLRELGNAQIFLKDFITNNWGYEVRPAMSDLAKVVEEFAPLLDLAGVPTEDANGTPINSFSEYIMSGVSSLLDQADQVIASLRLEFREQIPVEDVHTLTANSALRVLHLANENFQIPLFGDNQEREAVYDTVSNLILDRLAKVGPLASIAVSLAAMIDNKIVPDGTTPEGIPRFKEVSNRYEVLNNLKRAIKKALSPQD